MNRTNVDGKKLFEGLIRDLTEAVTKDLLHEDNVTYDLKQVLPHYESTAAQKRGVEKDCLEVKEKFKTDVFKKVMESENVQKIMEKRAELENTKNSSRAAWRINSDPVHDTLAQRRQVYLDHLEELEEEKRKWDDRVKEHRAQIEKLLKNRNL